MERLGMPLPSEIGVQPILDYIRELMEPTPYEENDVSSDLVEFHVSFTRKESNNMGPGGAFCWKRFWVIGSEVHYSAGFYATIMLGPMKPLTNGAETKNIMINLCDPDSLEQIKEVINETI
jgi:hypothetical protein